MANFSRIRRNTLTRSLALICLVVAQSVLSFAHFHPSVEPGSLDPMGISAAQMAGGQASFASHDGHCGASCQLSTTAPRSTEPGGEVARDRRPTPHGQPQRDCPGNEDGDHCLQCRAALQPALGTAQFSPELPGTVAAPLVESAALPLAIRPARGFDGRAPPLG